MSEFKAASFSDEFGGGPDLVGITTMTSSYYFVPPSGSTAERPQSAPPGMLRFNTDIERLEVWRNDHWATIVGESPNVGVSTAPAGDSFGGTSVRGVFIGNRNTPTFPSSPKSEYISIATLGNSVDFGTLTQQVSMNGSFSSSTRGVFFGGYNHPVAGARTASIRGYTFASTGSHVDFSSTVSTACQTCQGVSNQTRGLCFIGNPFPASGFLPTIEFVTISSIASAVDFGDLTGAIAAGITFSSPVRGVYAGGYLSPPNTNVIQYVTISTQGDATEFGDLTETSFTGAGAGNATRGMRMGGQTPSRSGTIDFVTIASTGDAQDFGDLLEAASSGFGGNMCSPTRAIYAGGFKDSGDENAIQYINIQTTGNAIDFGFLTEKKFQFTGASNGHGGL